MEYGRKPYKASNMDYKDYMSAIPHQFIRNRGYEIAGGEWRKPYDRKHPDYPEMMQYYDAGRYTLDELMKERMAFDKFIPEPIAPSVAVGRLASFPGYLTGLSMCAAYGDNIYFGLRDNPDIPLWKPNWWKYNVNSGVWTQLANYDGTYADGSFVCECGGKIYAGSGRYWSEYNISNDTWTQKADFVGYVNGVNANNTSYAAGGSVGGKIYVGTGSSIIDPYINNLWYEYDPATDTWTQKTNYPESMCYCQGCAVGNYIYVGGGASALGGWHGSNKLHRYNPSDNTWTEVASCPALTVSGTARQVAGVAVEHDGNFLMLYFINFLPSDVGTSKMWMYNTTSNSWSKYIDYKYDVSLVGGGVAAMVDGHLYSGIGQTVRGYYVREWWKQF